MTIVKGKGQGNNGIYLVDSIKDHRVKNGCTYFLVKWQGHESRNEWTWEPQENLEVGGDALVEGYFTRLAKRRQRAGKSASKRSSLVGTKTGVELGKRNESYHSNRPIRTTRSKWEPPTGTWENERFHIDGCQRDSIEGLMVYVTWANGHKTRHKMDVLCEKCPQKMLRYMDQYVFMS